MKRCIFGLFVCLFSLSVYAAPTVNIIPNQATYQVGDAVVLSVNLSGSPKIHGGGLNIRFNPDVLQAQAVVIDNVWSFANRSGVINNTGGSISDILFVSFNDVEGDLPVAMIKMAVVGNGDSGFSVSESVKNPFADTNGVLVSFGINNLFALNTELAEITEEATEAETTAEATIEEALQPVEQNTEQTSAPGSSADERTQVRGNNATLVRGPNNAIDDEVAVVSQNDRQFFLPSGTAAIPIDVTEDDVEGQSGNALRSDTVAVAKNVDTFLSTPEIAADDEPAAQSISEINSTDDIDVMEPESSIDYLNIVFILGAVFLLIIIFKLFF